MFHHKATKNTKGGKRLLRKDLMPSGNGAPAGTGRRRFREDERGRHMVSHNGSSSIGTMWELNAVMSRAEACPKDP
jgi:hypothetical protein